MFTMYYKIGTFQQKKHSFKLHSGNHMMYTRTPFISIIIIILVINSTFYTNVNYFSSVKENCSRSHDAHAGNECVQISGIPTTIFNGIFKDII